MISAFGDSDDEEIEQDSELREEPDHDIMPHSPLRPPPPPQCPIPPPPPLDMALFLQRTSHYDLDKVFQTAAAVPPIPQHVPTERPGGDARRAVMKARAAGLTRSVSEVFALTTSRTMSTEDTAVILETFGNVRCRFLLSLFKLSITIVLNSIILLNQ